MHRNRVAAPQPSTTRPSSARPSAPQPSTPQPDGPWREFGARLRHWRRRAGLTQAQLGAGIGYDHTAVSKIEHGTRRVTPRVADRLDDLLAAGGELRGALARAEEAELNAAVLPFAPGLTRPPLPGDPDERGPQAPWCAPPRRLPDYGLLCPLHGADGCAVPAPAELAALHAGFCAADPAAPPPLDADTAHALTGLLAARLRSGEAAAHPGLAAAVERTLRAVLARLASASASAEQRRPLARLAAEYAHAAGALRMQGGRNATAMACFDRALTWAELAGDTATQVAALSDMSTLARLDGDPAAALGYARETGRVAPGRHWAAAMGQIGRARAHALTGDVRETVRHIGRARLHLDHIGPRDEADAPWLSIASMRMRVESGAAAALRDVAAAVGDPVLARHALAAAESALHLLGSAQLPSTRLLFTVRVADCHACAHDPQAAVALLGRTLEAAPEEVLPALVGRELRGLRERLAAHRPVEAHRLAELAGS
ncbi:helix-turn-helix domain-containing protein [Kitasatospora sp. NPDC057936]|uniref:helix-turn-helix domain-containing protein n=1 Tax=Kitasatospora sp. NPDC057936 TaxID=3346283 RepID=UPI0036D85E0F